MWFALALSCSSGELPSKQSNQPALNGTPTRLWFAGDLHAADSRTDRLAELVDHIPNAAGFINLEGPIVEGPAYQRKGEKWILRNALSLPSSMKTWGIAGVSRANNHQFDAGFSGDKETRSLLEQFGIQSATDIEIARLTINEKRISLVSRYLKDDPETSLLPLLQSEREKSDILIVSYHTIEKTNLPTKGLQKAIDIGINAGVDIIVGHGSHRLGPVKRIGQTIVATGLGNLLFDCMCTQEKEAMALEVSIEMNGRINALILPLEAGLNGEGVKIATDHGGILDFIEALGDTPITRIGWKGSF